MEAAAGDALAVADRATSDVLAGVAEHGPGERERSASPADGGPDDAEPARGRPDLSQDEIARLRQRAKELKTEARKVKNDMKNKKRRRARVINRLRHLDTASVLQVLMDRGLELSGGKPAAAPATGPINVGGRGRWQGRAAMQSGNGEQKLVFLYNL